jgi:hypothetical protein
LRRERRRANSNSFVIAERSTRPAFAEAKLQLRAGRRPMDAALSGTSRVHGLPGRTPGQEGEASALFEYFPSEIPCFREFAGHSEVQARPAIRCSVS